MQLYKVYIKFMGKPVASTTYGVAPHISRIIADLKVAIAAGAPDTAKLELALAVTFACDGGEHDGGFPLSTLRCKTLESGATRIEVLNENQDDQYGVWETWPRSLKS